MISAVLLTNEDDLEADLWLTSIEPKVRRWIKDHNSSQVLCLAGFRAEEQPVFTDFANRLGCEEACWATYVDDDEDVIANGWLAHAVEPLDQAMSDYEQHFGFVLDQSKDVERRPTVH